MKTKITYVGNCPRCGEKQESTDKKDVDIDCWGCSVNANLERHDIIKDIEDEIKNSDWSTSQLNEPGLKRALEIIKKYDH